MHSTEIYQLIHCGKSKSRLLEVIQCSHKRWPLHFIDIWNCNCIEKKKNLPGCQENRVVSKIKIVYQIVILFNKSLLVLVCPDGTHSLHRLLKIGINRRLLHWHDPLQVPACSNIHPLKLIIFHMRVHFVRMRCRIECTSHVHCTKAGWDPCSEYIKPKSVTILLFHFQIDN